MGISKLDNQTVTSKRRQKRRLTGPRRGRNTRRSEEVKRCAAMCPCVSWTSLIFDNIQQIKKVDSSTNRQNVRRTQEEGCSQEASRSPNLQGDGRNRHQRALRSKGNPAAARSGCSKVAISNYISTNFKVGDRHNTLKASLLRFRNSICATSTIIAVTSDACSSVVH